MFDRLPRSGPDPRALVSFLALAASLQAAPAFAQEGEDIAPSHEAAESGEAIVITGSRIARRDFVADTPIVTVGIDRIVATGEPTLTCSAR